MENTLIPNHTPPICHCEKLQGYSAPGATQQSRPLQSGNALATRLFRYARNHMGFSIKSGIATAVLCLFFITSFAQTPYENNVFKPEIRSVEFYNTKKQASFPIITLGSQEKVLLAFDNLLGGSKDYSYTIEHCDADWNSSNLSTTEYLQSYLEDRITTYNYSSGTLQKYTHYELTLPNENIAPKIPGNYVLKVYEDGDQSKLVLTRRLYVVSQKLSVFGQVVPSSDNSLRETNQKVNFTINYGNLRVQNPAGELRT